jgi:S1-C subfamily serine protease
MTEQATTERGLLAELSDELARAVEVAGRSLVTVDARSQGPATGLVWDDAGTVVTAAHVVERTRDIGVVPGDGQRRSAQLVARDGGADLALLAFEAAQGAPVTPADWAPGDALKVGHLVLALGRPDPAAPMASFGVVSALGGPWRTDRGDVVDGYVRTDATLLPGFSGGALADSRGRVVGLVSSRFGPGGAVAIPGPALRALVRALLSGERSRRAYLGVSAQPVELQAALRERLGLAEEAGLMLLGVEPAGPAARAGLLVGDILLALGSRRLSDGEALQMALGAETIGKPTTARVVRGGALRELTVAPAERPG